MIGDKEREAVRAFVKDYAVRSLVCCFSGGKDSLAARAREMFQKFVELERNFRMGGSCFYLQGKKVRALDLAKQRTING